MFGKSLNRYKINQNKLTFLPKVFTFFIFLFFISGVFWYFRPFNAGEVKVLAINQIIKPENQSGKFFGYLSFYEEPITSKNAEAISTPNPEITVKSFDSRLIDSKIFYLSQNCMDISLQKCEFWSFDRSNDKLIKIDNNIAKNLQIPTQSNSKEADKINLKFAEFQDKDWYNFIIRGANSDSYRLFQIDKKNLQSTKIQIITQDNIDYTKYFR